MPYRLTWTERKKEEDYDTGFGIGPRFHPRFCNTKVVSETDRTITFERIVLDHQIAAELRYKSRKSRKSEKSEKSEKSRK